MEGRCRADRTRLDSQFATGPGPHGRGQRRGFASAASNNFRASSSSLAKTDLTESGKARASFAFIGPDGAVSSTRGRVILLR